MFERKKEAAERKHIELMKLVTCDNLMYKSLVVSNPFVTYCCNITNLIYCANSGLRITLT